ncbi:MAG: helix-turn-helix domain-containing protein [Rhodospirillales bacterium]|nr:helix-turn-helix domain-containing protein [Rhodospirillales bacterium]
MSIIKDTLASADMAAGMTALDRGLAARLRAEREARSWSIADLATRSGVSRAMISKIERAEASPTAALLGRLSGAFGLTLSNLLARAEGDCTGSGQVTRAGSQPVWRDPATGYLRRAVSPAGAVPEIVHVALPPGARIAYPAAAFLHLAGQCTYVLHGRLDFREGAVTHALAAGDCLALGPPAECEFHNPSAEETCIYLVVLARR